MKYVFFDLDGTLTDPGMGITNSVWEALRHFKIEVNDRSELYRFVGPPLIESFMEYYGMTRDQATEAVQVFRAYFESKGIFENVPYEGVREMLSAVRAMGYQMVVATSKPEEFAKRILDRFEIREFFDGVYGASMDETRTKKGEVIDYALASMGRPDLSNCLMVGDRKHDVMGAHENGFRALGVLYGYGDAAEFEAANADGIAEKISDVPGKVREMLGD